MKRTILCVLALATLSHTTASAQTSITSVSARTMRVEAGGSAARLTVLGDGLDRITGIRVLQRGRTVDGLVARLPTGTRSLSTRSGGQLVVELEADASVRPGGDYQLELTAGRQQLLVPASITVVAPEVPKITSASPTTITLGPRESGSVVLNGANLDMLTGAYVVDGDGRLVYHVRADLGSGTTSRTVRLTVPDAPNQRGPFGTLMTIMVAGEPGSATATPARVEVRPTYDLYITSCTLEPVPRRGWYRGSITVTNHAINTIAASLPDGAWLAEYDPADPMGIHKRVWVPAGGLYLPPGQSWDPEFEFYFPYDAPTRSMTFVLAPRDDERSHANNERTCTVPPHTMEPAPTPEAELVVSGLTVTPSSGPPSTEFAVTVTVENRGRGEFAPSSSQNGGSVRCTLPDESDTFRSLGAGETRQFTFRTSHSFAPGEKETTCTVSAPDGTVIESTDGARSRSATFMVTGSDDGGQP